LKRVNSATIFAMGKQLLQQIVDIDVSFNFRRQNVKYKIGDEASWTM